MAQTVGRSQQVLTLGSLALEQEREIPRAGPNTEGPDQKGRFRKAPSNTRFFLILSNTKIFSTEMKRFYQ